jgi:AraC-like DNA-binding protein
MLDVFPGVRLLALGPTPERARACSWSLGSGRAVVVEELARLVERTVSGRDAASDTVKLMLQSRGQALLSHAGRRAELGAGDLVLMDGAQPFALEMAPGYRQVVLELPRNLVGRRCQGLLGRAGESLRGVEPSHQLLSRTLDSIVEQVPKLTLERRAPLLEAVVALLASLVRSGARDPSESDRRFSRACADLDANLGDPELGAVMLAELQGISRRHLDAIFAARGQSPERLIWERRLERIGDELQNPAHARYSLIDIALAWGFSSQAHFSRAFRRKYGQSPSAFRRASTCGKSDALAERT